MTPMATRNYGTGRVFKRGSRWWLSYYLDGRELREPCGAKVITKAGAQQLLRERVRAADLSLVDPTVTIGELLDLFVEDRRNRARKSLKVAQARAEKIRRALGHLRATRVTAKHVARFVQDLQTGGASGPTINRYRAVWQRAFRIGSDAGLSVVAPYLPRHAESAPKRDYVSVERFEAVLAELSEPYRSVALSAFWTACRQGEIRRWRWEHVDLAARTVLLPETKSGTPRQIPPAQPVWAALIGLSMKCERDWPSCPWVFTLDGRAELSIWALRSAWVRACKRAGVSIRLHGLRHTAVTNYRAARVGEGSIMAISGHKTRSVLDRYGIQPQAKLREATEKLESSIRTKYGQSEESEPDGTVRLEADLVDSIALGGGGPCWIRTSDQRIMSPQL